MPLRDHFRPPLETRRHWEGFHGQWPATIVQHLCRQLPPRYFAEPRVHVGSQVEVDVASFHEETVTAASATGDGNGVATAVWAPPQPTRTLAIEFPAQELYEVHVYDERRGCRLVAAVELVSPANKDRAEHRRSFAIKCASYLQEGVCVVIVDVVTERRQNLYAELMDLVGLTDPFVLPEPPPIYAVSCRTARTDDSCRLDTWTEQLAVGASLPTLPLWLASDLAIPLELEQSYEETCQWLRIP
jgi:hypothetical protein